MKCVAPIPVPVTQSRPAGRAAAITPGRVVGNSFLRAAFSLGVAAGIASVPAVARADEGAAAAGKVVAAAPAASASEGEMTLGITLPSDKRDLFFDQPGIVRETNVVEGQAVKKGDLVAVQNDEQDLAELAGLKRDAESTATVDEAKVVVETAKVAVKASELTLATKKLELERIERIFKGGSGGDLEFEKGKLEAALAEQDVAKAGFDVKKYEQEVKKAELEQDLKRTKYERQQIRVKQMRVFCPIDGIVSKVDAKVGEMSVADRSRPSYVVVSNSPLWVEVRDMPVAIAQQLKQGQTLKVSHDNKNWEEAKLIFHEPVADAGSSTQMVRLELPNPTGRYSGMQVRVQLPKEIVAANQGVER